MEKLHSEKKEILIGTDQNLDLVKINSVSHVQEFLDLNYANILRPVINKPTRITHQTASLIDNFYTSNKEICMSAVLYSYISDHFPILFMFGKKSIGKCKEQTKFTYRKLSDTAIEQINTDLLNNNWENQMNNMNTSESFKFLTTAINSCVERHCPLKTASYSNKNLIREPWMTPGLLKSSRKANKLYALCCKLDKSHPKYIHFLEYRNNFNRIKRMAKKVL